VQEDYCYQPMHFARQLEGCDASTMYLGSTVLRSSMHLLRQAQTSAVTDSVVSSNADAGSRPAGLHVDVRYSITAEAQLQAQPQQGASVRVTASTLKRRKSGSSSQASEAADVDSQASPISPNKLTLKKVQMLRKIRNRCGYYKNVQMDVAVSNKVSSTANSSVASRPEPEMVPVLAANLDTERGRFVEYNAFLAYVLLID
jgi:hypothetical protein